MDGQYPISSLGAYYPSGYPPMMPPDTLQPQLHQLQTLSSMDSLGTYSDYDDPNRALLPPPGPQRSRRRQHHGSEHVKHRRTRSGCYTCRQRRVKCDESHPICDRCRKGKRECTYPGASSSPTTRQPRGGSRAKGSPDGSSQSDSDVEGDERVALSSIADEAEEEVVDGAPQTAVTDSGKLSERTSSVHEDSTSSPNELKLTSRRASAKSQAIRRDSRQSIKPEASRGERWNTLSKDVRFYLTYHQENMSHHHYAFKYDRGNFLKTTFIEMALNDGSAALLYAIVAFAAYHHTIASNDDKICVFLSYYNKSIAYLQQSLRNKRHSVVTLLTILQLATIEEFLGDWLNLMGHQRAAYQILTDLFTPQTVMQDETRRQLINWYLRFDLFAGLMAGEKTTLGREWFAAAADFYKRQTRDKPDDLGARFEEYFATGRLLATDVTLLFAAKSKEHIDDEQFAAGVQKLTSEFAQFGQIVENAFRDPSCFVKTFPRAPPASEQDIVDYRDPNFLYAGELATMNFVLLDHWAIDLMFRHQLTRATGRPPPPELTELALKKCKMLEAIQFGGASGSTAVLGAQATLGILAIFLPKDERHTMWCRRKFADIERLGYVYPTSYRTHMSELWSKDVTAWWLPNEVGLPSSLKMIKEFVEYRTPRATDAWATGVRDMSGIFRSLNIEEHSGISDELRSAGTASSASSWVPESSPEQPWI